MPQRSLSVRAGFLAFGNGTSAVVQLVVAAILARVLTDVEFGTYKQTYLILHMAGPLVTLGLPSALLYFIPLKKDRGRGVLTETLLILLATGLLFSCGL